MKRVSQFALAILLATMASAERATVSAQGGDQLRLQDVISVTVIDQPALTKKYTVEGDGRVTFPLLGRVPVAGLTPDQLASDLRRRLIDGFLKNPQVNVEVERPKRVFVFGGVSAPGVYPLAGEMTVMELLARAGYTGASEAIIVRPKNTRAPALPDDKDAKVIRVNLREFEKDLETGQLSRNVMLADGDTVYVPRFDPNRIYVSGQVRTPGAYSIPENTTLLQALALAGGPTEHASLGRIRIIRLTNGKQNTIKARLEDIVRPGDTIIVPERYF
jgi:polysaccharide export outer membrane protein